MDSVPWVMVPPHQNVEAGFRFTLASQRAAFTVQSGPAVMPLYSSLLDCHRVCPLGSACRLFQTTFSFPSPCPIWTGDTLAQASPIRACGTPKITCIFTLPGQWMRLPASIPFPLLVIDLSHPQIVSDAVFQLTLVCLLMLLFQHLNNKPCLPHGTFTERSPCSHVGM